MNKGLKALILAVFLLGAVATVSADESVYTDDSYFDDRGVTNQTELIDTDDNTTIETQLRLGNITDGKLLIEYYDEQTQGWKTAGLENSDSDDPFHDWDIYCGIEEDSGDTVPEADASNEDTCFNNEVGFYGDTFDWGSMDSISNSSNSITYRFKLVVQGTSDQYNTTELDDDVIYSQPVNFTWTRNSTVDAYTQNPTQNVNNWTDSITFELHTIQDKYGDIDKANIFIENYDNSSGQWDVSGTDVNEPFYNWTGDLSGLSQEDCGKDLSDDGSPLPSIRVTDLCDNQRVGFKGATSGWSIWNAQDGDMKNEIRYRLQIAMINSSAKWAEGENLWTTPVTVDYDRSFIYDEKIPEETTVAEGGEEDFYFYHPWSPSEIPDFITGAGGGMIFYDHNNEYWRPPSIDFFDTTKLSIPSETEGNDYHFRTEMKVDGKNITEGTASFRYRIHNSTNPLIQGDGNTVWYSDDIQIFNEERPKKVETENKFLFRNSTGSVKMYDSGTITDTEVDISRNPDSGEPGEYGEPDRLIGVPADIGYDGTLNMFYSSFPGGNDIQNDMYFANLNNQTTEKVKTEVSSVGSPIDLNNDGKFEVIPVTYSDYSGNDVVDGLWYYYIETGRISPLTTTANSNLEIHDVEDMNGDSRNEILTDSGIYRPKTGSIGGKGFGEAGEFVDVKGDGDSLRNSVPYVGANQSLNMYHFGKNGSSENLTVKAHDIGKTKDTDSDGRPEIYYTFNGSAKIYEYGEGTTTSLGISDDVVEISNSFGGKYGTRKLCRGLWCAETRGKMPQPRSLAWSPDGRYIAVGAEDSGLWLADTKNGLNVRKVVDNSNYWDIKIGWNPQGGEVAVNDEGTLYIYDTSNWSVKYTRNVGSNSENRLQYSPSGDLLVVNVGDSVRTFNTTDYSEKRTYTQSGSSEHSWQSAIRDVEASQNYVAYASEDNYAYIHDRETGDLVKTFWSGILDCGSLSCDEAMNEINIDPNETYVLAGADYDNHTIAEVGGDWETVKEYPKSSYEPIYSWDSTNWRPDGERVLLNSDGLRGETFLSVGDWNETDVPFNLGDSDSEYSPSGDWLASVDGKDLEIRRTPLGAVGNYPRLTGAKLVVNENSNRLEVNYDDPDFDVVDFTKPLPGNAVSDFQDTRAVVKGFGDSLKFLARPEDSIGLATNDTFQADLTVSKTELREDPASPITVDSQVLRKDIVIGNSGDPLEVRVNTNQPAYTVNTIQNGNYHRANFTGGYTVTGLWETDGVNVSEGNTTTPVTRPIPTLDEQYLGVPTYLKNNLEINLTRLQYGNNTYRIESGEKIAVSNNTTSGDFINESISGFQVDQNRFTIGQRYDSHTDLQLEENRGTDWVEVRTNYTVSEFTASENTPPRCRQRNNTKIDVSANADSQIPVELGCLTGVERNPGIVTAQVSENKTNLTYQATLRIYSDYTKSGEIDWRIPKSVFDDYFTPSTSIDSGTIGANIDGKNLGDTQIVDTGDEFVITVPDDFGNSSLEEGSHNAEFYFVAEETTEPPGDGDDGDDGDDGGDGGDGGDDGDEPSVNETTVEFENITISGIYGDTVTKSFDITNKKDEQTFVTLEIPDTDACQYFLLQSSRGSDNYGKIATYELPASSSGASSQETEISVLARVQFPTQEQLNNSDVEEPFTCQIDTSASTGKAGAVEITGDPTSSVFRDAISPVTNTIDNLFGGDDTDGTPTGGFNFSPSAWFGWIIVLLILAGLGYRYYQENYA